MVIFFGTTEIQTQELEEMVRFEEEERAWCFLTQKLSHFEKKKKKIDVFNVGSKIY